MGLTRLAVFASGRGSNLLAIQEAIESGRLPTHQVVQVVCDRPEAPVVQHAARLQIPCFAFAPKAYATKAAYEQEILTRLEAASVELVVLAGYMRLVGPTFLEAWEGRALNLHPSLLPAFPGKDAIGQAFRAQVPETGVTVHWVNAGMDTGPVIQQKRVPLLPGDTEDTLAERIHAVEHQLLPEVIRKVTAQP